MRALLLPLLLATTAVRAQPTAADSALARDVVAAAHFETTLGALTGALTQGGLSPGMEDVFDVDAIEDSTVAALLADVRPDALREALAYYRSDGYARTLAIAARRMEELSRPGAIEALQEQIQNPKKGSLADETLARRYVVANGLREMMPEMMRRMFTGLLEAVPEAAVSLEAEGGLDALLAQFEDEAFLAMYDSTQVVAMRVGLFGTPDDLLRSTLAFMESDAGLYVRDATLEATLAVMIPPMVDFMAARFSEFQAPDDEIDDVDLDRGDGPPPGVPGTEVYDVADVQPTLLGGLDGLQSRVVYPEFARRAGIEGQVIVQFIVDERGSVTDAVAVRSPNELLSEAALAAVAGSQFTPGTVRGRPVKVRFAVPIMFRLRDPAPPPTDG